MQNSGFILFCHIRTLGKQEHAKKSSGFRVVDCVQLSWTLKLFKKMYASTSANHSRNDAPPSYKEVMNNPYPDSRNPLFHSQPEVTSTVYNSYPDTRTPLIHSHPETIRTARSPHPDFLIHPHPETVPSVRNPYPDSRISVLHSHPETFSNRSIPIRQQTSIQVSRTNEAVKRGSYSEPTMFCIRLGVVLGIIIGTGLCLWEVSFQNSLGTNATWQEKKPKGLRAAFGGIILGIAGLCYFGDAFTNHTFKTINRIRSGELKEHLKEIRRGRPRITFYMECFHRDTYSTVVTNPDGSMRTEQRNDEITTWNGIKEFQFSSWADASSPMENSGAITRITFEKKFILANEETRASFEAQKQAFVAANRHRDREFTAGEIFEIESFRDEMVVASSSTCCVTNVCVYFIMVFTGLLYPWLCIINCCEGHVKYKHIVKVSV